MSSTRTFIALELSPGVQERTADLEERLRVSQANVKWVAPKNVHLTLKFLGEVTNEAVAEVCQRVSAAVAEIAPFRFDAHGAGAFPTLDRPRTLWLGVSAGELELVALHEAVQQSLSPMGFRREGRRYVPHMTIGRVRGNPGAAAGLAALVRDNADFEAGSVKVSEVVIFASYQEGKDPTYQPLGRAPLGNSI